MSTPRPRDGAGIPGLPGIPNWVGPGLDLLRSIFGGSGRQRGPAPTRQRFLELTRQINRDRALDELLRRAPVVQMSAEPAPLDVYRSPRPRRSQPRKKATRRARPKSKAPQLPLGISSAGMGVTDAMNDTFAQVLKQVQGEKRLQAFMEVKGGEPTRGRNLDPMRARVVDPGPRPAPLEVDLTSPIVVEVPSVEFVPTTGVSPGSGAQPGPRPQPDGRPRSAGAPGTARTPGQQRQPLPRPVALPNPWNWPTPVVLPAPLRTALPRLGIPARIGRPSLFDVPGAPGIAGSRLPTVGRITGLNPQPHPVPQEDLEEACECEPKKKRKREPKVRTDCKRYIVTQLRQGTRRSGTKEIPCE